jgi:flagellar biosynthesis/type III secretory pathway chaperone
MALNDPAAAGDLLALLDCLEAECQALLDQDLDKFESTLLRKRDLLARLSAHAAAASGGRRAGALAPSWRRALTRARELNRRNAIVLAPRMLANHARLRFLQSALGGPGLYGADGLSAPALLAVAPGHRA